MIFKHFLVCIVMVSREVRFLLLVLHFFSCMIFFMSLPLSVSLLGKASGCFICTSVSFSIVWWNTYSRVQIKIFSVTQSLEKDHLKKYLICNSFIFYFQIFLCIISSFIMSLFHGFLFCSSDNVCVIFFNWLKNWVKYLWVVKNITF